MNNVILVYSDDFKKLDFGPGHPMRGDRYQKAMDEFRKINLLDKLKIEKPESVKDDLITLFHTPDYVNKVREVSNSGRGTYGDEVPAVKGIYDIILLSVSASITAANYVTDKDYNVGINICGGWHHAFENRGRGFCVFNDVAIVANYLLKRKKLNRIMIIDYDAHHGDGTQRAFYDNPEVFTISFHQDPTTLYPFRTGYENEIGEGEGLGFNKNFPLPQFCTDTEFIAKFNQVTELIQDFKPEILILQMGVDGSRECQISNMQLTDGSYDHVSKTIVNLQKEINFKIIALGGGGFVHPMLGKNWGVQINNFIDRR